MSLFIHPNTPPKLAKEFAAVEHKYHRLAHELRVNVYHVYQLIKYGQEPRDPDIRSRLFLPRNPRRAPQPRAPKSPMQIAINTMTKETRKAINAHFKTKTHPSPSTPAGRSPTARHKGTH